MKLVSQARQKVVHFVSSHSIQSHFIARVTFNRLLKRHNFHPFGSKSNSYDKEGTRRMVCMTLM